MGLMRKTEHYVSRQDGRVYYERVGQGEPVIILHAGGTSGRVWAKVVDALASHFTCYVPDIPGHDHSDIPERQYSIADYTRAILDVMDGAGVEEANILGAHTGALVGFDLAANYPERVTKLIFDGLPYWDLEGGQEFWRTFFLPRFTDTTSYDVPVEPLTTWEQAKANNSKLEREFWEWREEIKRKSRRWMTLTFQSLTAYDGQAVAHKISAPTLLIYGDGDALRPGEQRANRDIKGSVVKIVPGVDGMAHEDKPDEVAQLALDFLRGHP